MHARSDAPNCNDAKLAIVAAAIRRHLCVVPIEANTGGQIDTVPGQIAARLASSQSNGPILGIPICSYNLLRRQVDGVAMICASARWRRPETPDKRRTNSRGLSCARRP